ncbi:hypothetical protein [Streptomyces sp. NPDC016845]|uniref:hypothetical protein n=1 Tax=Streptomyces sp. NPDC016845 TaxID=3364972 RepID=UPI00378C80BA
MGKISRHGGPSIEGADIDQDSGEVTPLAEPDEAKETETSEDTPAEPETPAEQSAPDVAEQSTEQQRPRRGRKSAE